MRALLTSIIFEQSCINPDHGMLVRSPSQIAAAIDILTEDAFLEVFHCYLCRGGYNDWHALVDVCRRWRNVFSVHQFAWFCCLFARPQHLWKKQCVSYHTFLSSQPASITQRLVWMTLLPHWSTMTHSPSWHIPSFARRKTWCRPFLVYSILGWISTMSRKTQVRLAFHFRHYRTTFVDPVLFYTSNSRYTSPDTMFICLSALAGLVELRIKFYSNETHLYCP